MDHIIEIRDQEGNIVTTVDITNIELVNLQQGNKNWYLAVWHVVKQRWIVALITPNQEVARDAIKKITEGLKSKEGPLHPFPHGKLEITSDNGDSS